MYALDVQSKTLTTVVSDGYYREGSSWRFIVSEPRPFLGIIPVQVTKNCTDLKDVACALLDIDAIQKSIKINWLIQKELPKGISASLTNTYTFILNIFPEANIRDGDEIHVDVGIYNSLQKTGYKLAQDIILVYRKNDPILTIDSIWIPKNKEYRVVAEGFRSTNILTTIDFYTLQRNDLGQCSLESSRDFQNASFEVTEALNEGMKSTAYIKIQSPIQYNAECLFASINGEMALVENMTIPEFTVSWEVWVQLSPELDMKTEVTFSFSSPLFIESGSVNSEEFIDNRTKAKVEFLKHLSISSWIEAKIDDLVLYPKKAILLLPLLADKKYSFSLDELEDIYGQITSLDFPVQVKREPYLSVKTKERYHTFSKLQNPEFQLYSYWIGTGSQEISVCRVSLDNFSRLEQIYDVGKKGDSWILYSILSSSWSGVYGCEKTILSIPEGSYSYKFTLQDVLKKKEVGQYVLFFSKIEDITKAQNFVKPILFSILDTNIVMKVSQEGDSLFLVTDIYTWKPMKDQEIMVYQNISRSVERTWNSQKGMYDLKYIPLAEKRFSTWVYIWKTNNEGFLQVNLKNYIKDGDPYSLTFEDWWGSQEDGSYRSFVAVVRSDSHFWFVVSTWNDGIAPWNFWFDTSDTRYYYGSLQRYNAYIHTDRMLYLPGEEVYIHGILRENNGKLVVPKNKNYTVTVTDSFWKTLSSQAVQINEFGSFSVKSPLPKEADMGTYTVQLIGETPDTSYIPGGYTNFQVEIFKNPTFQITVDAEWIELDNGVIAVKKEANKDVSNWWYESVYNGAFTLNAKVLARYYNGAILKNANFSYKILRKEYWGDNYWAECFWWCYYEGNTEFYTEWVWRLDGDGYGIIRTPVDFTSFYADYKYIIEVTVIDPLTGETITSAWNLIVKLPAEVKEYNPASIANVVPDRKFISAWDVFRAWIRFNDTPWKLGYNNKYEYKIVAKQYTNRIIQDVRWVSRSVLKEEDTVISSGVLTSTGRLLTQSGILIFTGKYQNSGEYNLVIQPIWYSGSDETRISRTAFYVYGTGNAKNPIIDDNKIHVFTEKPVYKLGETWKILVRLPFNQGKILLTTEKWGVIDKKYIDVTSNLFIHEFQVDESYFPNAYISVVALETISNWDSKTITRNPTYRVGYAEVVVDQSEKLGTIAISPDKNDYKVGENVNISLALKNKKWEGIKGEFAVMVIDDSLISLLGNIDLDILPKFYQKVGLWIHTALSLLWMEENFYFSRKWIAGGSGGKWWDWIVSTRTIFKNTAYYNPSVITDEKWYAKVNFTLPDNITNYRIIVVANTKDSTFAVGEKMIQVRKDIVATAHAPYIVRNGDRFVVSASIFNNTKTIQSLIVAFEANPLDIQWSNEQKITLEPGKTLSVDFPASVDKKSKAVKLSYVIRVKNMSWITLDAIEQKIDYVLDPILIERYQQNIILTGSKIIPIPLDKSNVNENQSTFSLRISPTFLPSMEDVLQSLKMYPYGCIEQTTSSTLPNALLLAVSNLIDTTKFSPEDLRANVAAWVKRIAWMQTDIGGFSYWPGDTVTNSQITPYVVRSLIAMSELWADVPREIIDRSMSYLESNISAYADNNEKAELFWTLARAKNNKAKVVADSIDSNTLTLHSLLAYTYGMHYLDQQKIIKFDIRLIDRIRAELKKTKQSEYNWYYWDLLADKALFASLLIDRTGYFNEAEGILRELAKNDWDSYYYSTQTKYQVFLAFFKHAQKIKQLPTTEVTVKYGAYQWVLTIWGNKLVHSLEVPFADIGNELNFSFRSQYPIYANITHSLYPADPYAITKKDNGVKISRTLFSVDEEAWVFVSGEGTYNQEIQYLHVTPVNDKVIHKWKLYKVVIEANIPTKKDMNWTNFVLEDFFPGWFRPINKVFHSADSLLGATSNMFYSTQNKIDRILAHAPWWYGDSVHYEYYFRPEFEGNFIWPPATGYFMYNPSIMWFTEYESLTVKKN